MNQLMYYGGFALSIALLILTVIFFFAFKVPSIHTYFRRNSRKGLAAAEVINKQAKKKPRGPQRITRTEYLNRTEVINIKDNEQVKEEKTENTSSNTKQDDDNKTAVLDETDLL